MSNKKNSNKRKKMSPTVLQESIINYLRKNPTNSYTVKHLIRKVKTANHYNEVQDVLDALAEKNTLRKSRRGKYKWNKKSHSKKKKRKSGNIDVGIMDVTRSGAAYVVCDDFKHDKDIFVPQNKHKGALNGDTVEVRWYLSNRGKPRGEVLQVVKRRTEHFVGKAVLSNKFAFVAPDDTNIPFDILLDTKNLPKELNSGDKVVVRVTKWHSNHKENPKGEITIVFGSEDSNDVQMQSILVQKGFSLTFPPEVLKENEEIDVRIKPEEIKKRRDMRKITTFTIDPDTAKDFDDALSIQELENGNFEVGIHIADVTHYVRPGTALDEEAAKRTTSVYLVDRVLPMLPEKLSNGACSLRPHEEKYTFSAVFELDRQANVKSEWFGKTVTYSDRRFTYDQAQEVLDTGKGEFVDELQLLNRFAEKLRKKRFKKGAINFESPEVKFKLGEDGEPLDVYLKVRKDANMLIEDFMLLANKRVGNLLHRQLKQTGNEWPMIYRIHDEPDMEKVANFADFAGALGYPIKAKNPKQVKKAYGAMLRKSEGKPEHSVLQQLAIRTMSKAVYSVDNIGHYGLGFDTYSHFTSPIRRYADVLAHRILQDFLSKNGKQMRKHKLEALCKHISKKERDAMEAERESTKYKQAEFLEDHIGDVFEGIITGIAPHGVYVTLNANYCEGMIRYEKMYDTFVMDENGFSIQSQSEKYRMGSDVWVKVIGSDRIKRQMDFELLDPSKYANRSNTSNKKKASKKEAPSNQSKPSNKTKKEEKLDLRKQQKTFQSLLKKTHKMWEDSDIKKEAEKRNRKWGYALTTGALTEDAVLLLKFNPKAMPNKDYGQQQELPKKDFKPKRGNQQKFFLTYFKDEPLVDAFLCPLRSLDELQISERDLEMSVPILKKVLSLAKPELIISFSNHVQTFLSENNLLSKEESKMFQRGKRKIDVLRAKIRVGRQSKPILFLPNPTNRISKKLKEDAWEWGLEKL